MFLLLAACGSGNSGTTTTGGTMSFTTLGAGGVAAGAGSSGTTGHPASGSSGTIAAGGSSGVAGSIGGPTGTATGTNGTVAGPNTAASATGSTGTSGTTGSGACGASNFDVSCGGGNDCPASSTCGANDTCACDEGQIAVSCSGVACDANNPCAYPNWWCVPRQGGACGAVNFDVPCVPPDGGEVQYCPSGSTCDANNSCTCTGGLVATSCSGAECSESSPCGYPNWWCATPGAATTTTVGASSSGGGTSGTTGTTFTACPPPQGTTGANNCGASNFTSPCTDSSGSTTYCPANATCGADDECYCPLGYAAVSCSGTLCADQQCNYPDWWCEPDPVPSNAGTVADGTCETCSLSGGTCANGGSCIPIRPNATTGICAVACDSSDSCADPNSTCVDPGNNTAACYPWACLGADQSAPSCGLPHEPWPQVPNQGSGGVSAVSAVIITYAPWDGGGSYPYTSAMQSWGANVMTSSYPTLAGGEYGVGATSFAGTAQLGAVPPAVIYDSDVQTWVSELVTGGTILPGAGTVLVFFIPGSSTFYRDAAQTEELCTQLVAYHSSTVVDGANVLYAVIADCGPATVFGLTDLQSIMAVTSHEIMEAATDPVNEDGWAYPYPFPHQDPWANMGGEIGDMCDWVTESYDAAGDIVQRVFSNTRAAAGGDPCSPAVSMPAAAVTSLPYSVISSPGASVTVPLIGWTTDSTSVPWVNLTYLGNTTEPIPLSLPINGLVPVTLSVPSTSGAYLTKLVASAPGATVTEWPIYVEAF